MQSAPPPQVSRGVDINTGAQPGPREREGGEGDVFLSATHGAEGGAAGRGGDSQASNSCISHDTAAVRASWEQCPARGNRSSTGGWWRWLGGQRCSPCWPARRGGGISAARTPVRRCPGDTQCHEAVPTGRHCSSDSLPRCPAQPPAWLLFSSSLWSMGCRLWLHPNPLSRLIRL